MELSQSQKKVTRLVETDTVEASEFKEDFADVDFAEEFGKVRLRRRFDGGKKRKILRSQRNDRRESWVSRRDCASLSSDDAKRSLFSIVCI